jgi:PIN domain nuclease of toxin-antitoxin system
MANYDRATVIANPRHKRYRDGTRWEVVIKRDLGRDDFNVDAPGSASRIAGQRLRRVAGASDHLLASDGLPAIHKDPFDRVLSTGNHRGYTLLTTDLLVAKYPGPIQTV